MGGGPIGPSRGAPGGRRCSRKLKGVGLGLVFLCAIPGIAQVAAAESPQGPPTCDKLASPSGSDGGTGTLGDPYATPKKLIDSLAPGQTGCLRAGTYTFAQLDLINAQHHPGPLRIRGGDAARADQGEALGPPLHDRGHEARRPRRRRAIGPKIYADGFVLRDNEITNASHLDLRPRLGAGTTASGAPGRGDRAQPDPRLRRAPVHQQGARHLPLRGPGRDRSRQLDLRQRRPGRAAVLRGGRLPDHRQRDLQQRRRPQLLRRQRPARGGQHHRQLEPGLERLRRVHRKPRRGRAARQLRLGRRSPATPPTAASSPPTSSARPAT